MTLVVCEARDAEPVHLPPARRLHLAALASLIFCTVCGGAFGLEPLVGAVGSGWAIVLILVTPLLFGLPIALMVAELTSMMPDEGGYYIWVRETLGRFWGLQEGWWTIGYSIVLTAIYPVLFVTYLTYFFPALATGGDGVSGWQGPLVRWLLAVAMIGVSTALNWRGAKTVGRYAEFSVAAILGAFGVMVVAALSRDSALRHASATIVDDLSEGGGRSALLLGLSTVIFNYSGWDNASTYAGEVDDAQRVYPRALALVLPATVLAYLFPVVAGVAVTTDPAVWSAEAGWPVIARTIGGDWMGSLLALAGLISTWSLFNSQLLYISRLPYVMALDGWLPRAFTRASTVTGTPTVALAWACVLSALFAAVSFGNLVVMYVLLYGAALALEFLALVALRLRQPDAKRGFRVPGGWLGIAYVCIAPMAVALAVILASLREEASYTVQLLAVTFVLVSGVALYFARRRYASEREDVAVSAASADLSLSRSTDSR